MPPNTGTLTSLRASIAAPVANTNGASPRMNANEVIITGRNRRRAPSVAAISKGTPCSRRSFANSTIRMPFFAAKSDQHHHADLCIQIQSQTECDNAEERAGHADRHRHQHRNRDGPAFVQRHQEQIREQDREPENDRRLPLGSFLLKRNIGPIAAITARQCLGGNLIHRRQRLAG